MDKIKKHEAVILSFESAIDAISWSLNLSTYILNNNINLASFSHISLSDTFPFLPKVNWNNSLEYAEMLPLATCVFYISACAEGYFDLFSKEEINQEKKSDLHSARMILKVIRNSLAHPHVGCDGMIKIRWNVKDKKYKMKFVVEEIGIILDVTNLDQRDFHLSDLGGWPNFIKLLKYLKVDLQNAVFKSVKNAAM